MDDEEERQEIARELLAKGCAELVRREQPIEPALQLIDSSLLVCPMLRACAVSVCVCGWLHL